MHVNKRALHTAVRGSLRCTAHTQTNTQRNSQRSQGLSCISRMFLCVQQPPGATKQIKGSKPASDLKALRSSHHHTETKQLAHTSHRAADPGGEFTAAQHLGRIWISSWRNPDEISRAAQWVTSVPGSGTHGLLVLRLLSFLRI